jgi:serine/threonine-protein kinase
MHGGEAQVGECQIKLVSFGPESPGHKKARRYLTKRDGLTGLLVGEHLMTAVDEEGLFADWAEVPMQVARYELHGRNRQGSEPPRILDMLALRIAALRVVELTEMLLRRLTPAVAGRTGPLKFVVSMAGQDFDEARHVVEQIVSQVQDMLPESLELGATLIKGEPGRPARTLLE